MAIAYRFHNYQSLGAPQSVVDVIRRVGYSPALKELRDYLVAQGWVDLGYKPNGRPIRAGTADSTHTWGALDIRYADPGPGRDVGLWFLNSVLLPHSRELGINAVHDYFGCRIWRPPGTSGRPAGGIDAGWKKQKANPSNGMGQSWAKYFHIELHPDAFGKTGALAAVLKAMGKPSAPAPAPKPDPAPITPKPAPVKEITVQFTTKELKIGAKGAEVKRLQQIVNDVARYGLKVDGQFGMTTAGAVMDVQRVYGLKVDGLVGPATWGRFVSEWLKKG